MRQCTYAIDDTIFNHSYPEMDSPYTLDMTSPYHVAVLMELLNMTVNEPGICKTDSISHKESASSLSEQTISLTVNSHNKLVSKSTGQLWTPPTAGFVRVHFSKTTAMPTMDKMISSDALKVGLSGWMKLSLTSLYVWSVTDFGKDYFMGKHRFGPTKIFGMHVDRYVLHHEAGPGND
jgi:hypothetical protein